MPNQSTNQMIGPFQLLHQMSSDALVATWHARDMNLDREVVLLLLSLQLADRVADVPELLRQSEQLTHLRHAHLLPPYAVMQLDGQIAIATEYLSSPTLTATLQIRDRLPWDEMLALLQPLCAGLDYMHSLNIVHAHIHPDVIHLDTEQGVLLTGLMPPALASQRADFSPPSTRFLAYQAPEVWQAGMIGAQTDVYALGCLVYEVLRGEPLFTGRTLAAVQQARLRGPRFPTAWPEKLADEVEVILRTAVAPDPAERYASAGAFYQALYDFTEATAQAKQHVAKPPVLWSRVLPLLTWLLITLIVLGAIFVAVTWGSR